MTIHLCLVGAKPVEKSASSQDRPGELLSQVLQEEPKRDSYTLHALSADPDHLKQELTAPTFQVKTSDKVVFVDCPLNSTTEWWNQNHSRFIAVFDDKQIKNKLIQSGGVYLVQPSVADSTNIISSDAKRIQALNLVGMTQNVFSGMSRFLRERDSAELIDSAQALGEFKRERERTHPDIFQRTIFHLGADGLVGAKNKAAVEKPARILLEFINHVAKLK